MYIIFIFICILIFGLYKYNIEKFANINIYSVFCDSFSKNNIETVSKYDIYGFKEKELQSNKKQILYNTIFDRCPIKLTSKNAAKLVKADQFHYILDTRSNHERKKGYIVNSIFMESIDNDTNIDKLGDLKNISKEDFILVYSTNGKKAFYASRNLKQFGKFKNVYYIADGGYSFFKNSLKLAKKINTDSCKKNFNHTLLCSY